MSTTAPSGYYAAPIPGTTRWAVVQQCPSTHVATVVVDCPNEATAREQAAAMDDERALLARLGAHFPPPRWRHAGRAAGIYPLPSEDALL